MQGAGGRESAGVQSRDPVLADGSPARKPAEGGMAGDAVALISWGCMPRLPGLLPGPAREKNTGPNPSPSGAAHICRNHKLEDRAYVPAVPGAEIPHEPELAPGGPDPDRVGAWRTGVHAPAVSVPHLPVGRDPEPVRPEPDAPAAPGIFHKEKILHLTSMKAQPQDSCQDPVPAIVFLSLV